MFNHNILSSPLAQNRIFLVVFSFAVAQTEAPKAGVAQLVEQLICNHQVGGSSPFTGSKYLQ
jgi:hypothetical protein